MRRSATELAGKSALVTGGSGGIGGETATRLAAAGASVAVHYYSNSDSAQKIADQIISAGGQSNDCWR